MAKKTKAQAALEVDKHVEPKACFVTFTGNKDGWAPLTGTGCAHWVAHQDGIKKGTKGNSACDEGYAIRVRQVIDGLGIVDVANVQVGDTWANAGLTHCGLVTAVVAGKKAGDAPTITIQHCSSGQGKVATNDWKAYFNSGGSFYR